MITSGGPKLLKALAGDSIGKVRCSYKVVVNRVYWSINFVHLLYNIHSYMCIPLMDEVYEGR